MVRSMKALVILVVVPCMMAATMPVGSLTSFGDSTISGVNVSSGTAVFPGDVISTTKSGALFTLSQGGTIQLGVDSQVRIPKNASAGIEIVKGMSRVQSKAGLVLLASDWRLQGQPATNGQLTADVLRDNDGRVSLNVSSGQFLAHSNHGDVTLVAQAGKPLMLPASLPEPTPPAPPQGGSGGSKSSGSGLTKGEWAALVIGVAGLSIGAAALATRPTDQSSAVASLSSQVATLNTQISGLNSQITTLKASLTAVATASQNIQTLSASLNSQLAALNAAQAALAADQVTINGIVAKLAAGQTLTASDQAALTAAQADVVKQSGAISSASTAATNLINQINKITIPSPSAPSA
jgi:prefoldin subunit 5